jgi:hypothetical protein
MTTTLPAELRYNWYALRRNEDITGISGTGTVAYVLHLDDNTYSRGALMFWDTSWATIGWYPDLDTLADIHGHDGRTVIERIKPDELNRAVRLFRAGLPNIADAAMYCTLLLAGV